VPRTSRAARRARGRARVGRGSSRCRPRPRSPASSISTASTPVCTPPVPITGTPGARRDVCTARTRRLDRRTGEAAPPPPSTGRRVSASIQTHHGVHEGSPSAPASTAAGDRREIGHIR
jgi:hypothetical protein